MICSRNAAENAFLLLALISSHTMPRHPLLPLGLPVRPQELEQGVSTWEHFPFNSHCKAPFLYRTQIFLFFRIQQVTFPTTLKAYTYPPKPLIIYHCTFTRMTDNFDCCSFPHLLQFRIKQDLPSSKKSSFPRSINVLHRENPKRSLLNWFPLQWTLTHLTKRERGKKKWKRKGFVPTFIFTVEQRV